MGESRCSLRCIRGPGAVQCLAAVAAPPDLQCLQGVRTLSVTAAAASAGVCVRVYRVVAAMARDVRTSSMGGGVLSGPDKPTIVHCKELKDHLLLQELIDGQVTSHKEVYLWVDVNGVNIIEASTRKVTWKAAYNEITAWAVEQDRFKVKMVGKKNKLMFTL